MNPRVFDQSTLLAARAIEAQELGRPQLPTHVALPGAKVAIPHDTLLAHHDFGHPEHEIVRRINAQWNRENAGRLESHARWVTGPYAQALQAIREAQAREPSGGEE